MRDLKYHIVRADLDDDLQPIETPKGCGGIALDLRRGPRPLGFLLRRSRESSWLSAQDVRSWIEREIPEADRTQPIPYPESAAPMPAVTISVCTKDRPKLLRRCLSAIDALLIHPTDAPPLVQVIDNNSTTNETRTVANTFPGVQYIVEKRTGLNFARNRALAEARGEIVAYIDDDTVVDRHWLLGLRQAWARRPDAGGFSGQILPYALDTKARVLFEQMGGFRGGFQPIVYGRYSDTDPLYPCATSFGGGCNMAFRRDLMLKLGGFDEALDTGAPLPGGGDLDAFYQIVSHGCDLVYEPQMLVYHEHRADMAGLRRQIRRSWGMGTMAFLTKIRDFDPAHREKAGIFIQSWLRDLRRKLNPLSRRRGARTWDLVLQEYIGALMGLNGAYVRSRRLTDAIRQSD
jgi:GT2 family glycosyltransferase